MSSSTRFKVLFPVQGHTGRASLEHRMSQGEFDNFSYIGVEFCNVKVEVLGVPVELQVWMSRGAERFREFGAAQLRNTVLVILPVDLSGAAQPNPDWQYTMKQLKRSQLECPVFLVGCKADIADDVVLEQTKAAAASLSLPLYTTSSKTGLGVTELVQAMARTCLGYPVSHAPWSPGSHLQYPSTTRLSMFYTLLVLQRVAAGLPRDAKYLVCRHVAEQISFQIGQPKEMDQQSWCSVC